MRSFGADAFVFLMVMAVSNFYEYCEIIFIIILRVCQNGDIQVTLTNIFFAIQQFPQITTVTVIKLFWAT